MWHLKRCPFFDQQGERVKEKGTHMSDLLVADSAAVYPRWTGTAQFDQKLDGISNEEHVGIDQDQWMIVSAEIGGGEHEHRLRVLAVHRSQIPEGDDVFALIAEANGGVIPVTEFLAHDVDAYDLLRSTSHIFKLHLRRQETGNLPLNVVAHFDSPQGWEDPE